MMRCEVLNCTSNDGGYCLAQNQKFIFPAGMILFHHQDIPYTHIHPYPASSPLPPRRCLLAAAFSAGGSFA